MRYLIILVSATLLFSCKKDETPRSNLSFELAYNLDGLSFETDTVAYTLPEGIPFSITRLEWYLSDIYLYKDGKRTTVRFLEYLNVREPELITVPNIEIGQYDSVFMHIGLPADRNISYALGNDPAHIGMNWPDNMGGGYHFMKLEGKAIHEANVFGYAIHLGNNDYYVRCKIADSFEITEADKTVIIEANILEWFKNPYSYSIVTDGTYTMGIDTLMQHIADNGHNVLQMRE